LIVERSSSGAILVVAETREGVATPLTRELLGLAQQLASGLGGEVTAVLIASRDAAAGDLIAHGADRVYWCEQAEDYEGEVWLPCVERLARELEPAAVLVGHTPSGADLAPRLAFRLESGVATACVGAAVESGRLLFTRPCYGGNVRETLSYSAAAVVATIKAGVGTPQAQPARRGEIVKVAAQTPPRRTRVIGRERETGQKTRLEDAKIIVAGGRGLEGPEGFRVLHDLAAVLGGAVGSSRVPCDLGWCPHSWQIGLTGKTVTPELYFAVGISGAGHHMAGCGNAKTIVAINTDPGAAIFKEARFGIIGDYRKVVPALTDAVAQLKKDD
jgi:electron transfer flavoprotein alpha subunit